MQDINYHSTCFFFDIDKKSWFVRDIFQDLETGKDKLFSFTAIIQTKFLPSLK